VDFQQGPKIESRVFENIVQGMSDGVMFIDNQGQVVLSNPALLEILSITQNELESGQWVHRMFTPEVNVELRDLLFGVVQDHLCFLNRSVPYTSPQGEAKHLIVTATPLADDSADAEVPRGILIMVNDATEMVSLMEGAWRLYQEKAESLDRLARAVAHEIRNPATTIGGFARRLLKKNKEESNRAQYLEGILAGTRRLEEVVREVRSYAELPPPNPEPVEVLPWLRHRVEGYEERMAWQGISLQWVVPPDLEDSFTAEFDPGLISRVVKVLIDNALDAMPEGGHLSLSVREGGQEFILEVIDTGKGLSPRDIPYVFDPFYTTKAKGVGMNLAIAKTISREHGGDLLATNGPERGAVFTLRLPRKSLQYALGKRPLLKPTTLPSHA
jgi:PAS domain S-box-containing protein